MAVPLVGFTSALALRSSSLLHSDDSYDPINNPASDAKDRAIQEAEEQDALLQISDFLVHSDYDSNDAQWRFRVCIHDLLDEDVLAEEDQDSSLELEETASVLSDQTSNASIRVFFGPQPTSVPPGWKQHATSTPKGLHAVDRTLSVPSDIPSPGCSPLSLARDDATHNSSLDNPDVKIYDTYSSIAPEELAPDTQDVDVKQAGSSHDLARPSSPISEPSPTPKSLSSIRAGTSISPDTSASSEKSDVSVLKTSTKAVVDPVEQPATRHHPTRREETPYVLPMCPLHRTAQSNARVLKLTNLPWSVTVSTLVKWLGKDVEQALTSAIGQIISVHILCDRSKGKTKCPAYVEVSSSDVARNVIRRRNLKELEGRAINITTVPRKELLAAIFPTWAQANLATSGKVPIITNAELENLVELCKLKSPFAKSTPERPYMNILSIAVKYPWKSVDLLNPENEEQAKVLQAVRDGYKLLNQHGKRIANYNTIKGLFATFLEKYGGVSGSLRPIPVSTSRNLPPVSADTSAFLPRKPRISQTLLDLLSSHGQCRDNGINASKTGSVKNVLAGNTPPFLPESIKQQFKTLQDAPVKKEGTYKITPFHLPAKPQIQPPCTPLKPDYDNHNGLGCASDDRDGAAIQTNRGNYGQKPTYAMVASNFGLSPDVVEKTVKVETLFTPVRMPEVKQTQPFEIDPSDTSRDRSFNTTTDCSQSGEVVNTTKSDTVGYSPLLEMAEELGVSAETIKAIIKRLGALI